MTFDTLQYVDGGGSTQEVALPLQNLAARGGAVKMVFNPVSHGASTFVISWAQRPETGIAIPFKSRCIVYAGRTSSTGAPNSFSGGTILFQGRRTDNSGSSSPSSVTTQITLSDAWWDLEHAVFQHKWKYVSGVVSSTPTYSQYSWPDAVLFQADPMGTYSPAPVYQTITTWQTIQEILAWATGYVTPSTAANAIQLQLAASAEFTPVYVSWYPVRAAKCAEALKICLRPHPGVYTEIDYTTTPPTLHFRNRTNFTPVTLPYAATDGNGVVHIASDIQSLDHLVPDRVALFYRINASVNGQQTTNLALDVYPWSNQSVTGPIALGQRISGVGIALQSCASGSHTIPVGLDNGLLNLDFSVDITGANSINITNNFVSNAFNPTSLALWRNKVAALKQVVEGGQIPNDGSTGALTLVNSSAYNSSSNPKGIQIIGDDGNDYSSSYGTALPYYTGMPVYQWMQNGGVYVSAVTCTVKAYFTYQKANTTGVSATPFTDVAHEHEHTMRIVLTNAPTAPYTLSGATSIGETLPANLAQAIYTELSVLQWKLRHQIIQVAASAPTAVPTLIKPGKNSINLSGGASAWATMNATPETVSIELFRTGAGFMGAKQTISCGPVNHLEPDYLIQLHNVFWNRNKSGIDPTARLDGGGTNQQNSSSAPAVENSVPASPVPEVTNHVFVDGSGNISNVQIGAGASGGGQPIISARYLDPSAGTPITTYPQINIKLSDLVPSSGQPQPIAKFQSFIDSSGNTQYVLATAPVSGGGGALGSYRFKAEYGDYILAAPVNSSGVEGAAILLGATLISGGTAYSPGDILTLAGGTGTPASIKVLTTSSGVIATYAINAVGSYTANPSSPNSPTGGTGTGASFSIVVSNQVAIAKPWKLRQSLTSAVIFGTTWTYTFAGSGPVVRTASTGSGGSLIQIAEIITPPYLTGADQLNGSGSLLDDVIYAQAESGYVNVTALIGGVSVPCNLIDLNVDGRAWATYVTS